MSADKDQDKDDDVIDQFLVERGHSPDEIEKIKEHLAKLDDEMFHDSVFDSIASGKIDLDAIVKEALGK